MLTLLLINLFFGPEKNNTSKDTLEIWFQTSKYTIPASVKILVQNYTNSWIVIDTCNHIDIFKSGDKIVFWEDICKEIEVDSESSYVIDYSNEYKQFDTTWKYTMEAKIWEKKFMDQFELKNKWMIAKLFIWIIYKPIYNLVVGLIEIFNWSFWWAIISITIILKLVLLWPQQRMMVSQRKIQEMQPKIKQIQEQYKWDQATMWQKLMELYSKEKINPLGSCWFLLIQLPILLVVYNVIRWIQTPANWYYLYSFLNDFSLSHINFNFYWLDLLWERWVQWILLWITVALVQFIQIKISLPKKKEENKKWVVLEKKENEKDYSSMMPDPDMMNKFMLYIMPLMVWFFTYSWFAAIWLYWWISTLFTLIQNIFVNKMLKK